MVEKVRSWLSRARPRLDQDDLMALRLMLAFGAVIAGVGMLYLPAAFIVAGAGYLAFGLHRGWF